ncbi:MAG: alpha/beta fold hydrolase [Myxococcota bacterium]
MTGPRRIPVGELEVEYAESGAGDRALVLVHGFTGSRDDFSDVLPALGARGRTIAVDNRGHGGTSNPGGGYDFDRLVTDLAGFLDALDLPRCDLLGHSLGGMVALRFALAHPARTASLVLMDTAPRGLGPAAKIFDAGAAVVRERGMQGLWQLMRNAPRPDPAPPVAKTIARLGEAAYWSRIERKILAMDPQAFVELARLLGEHEPVESRLGEIACPTTVVVGEYDVPFRGSSDGLAAGIPGAILEVIPDAAHSPQMENEAVWLAAIEAHLARART